MDEKSTTEKTEGDKSKKGIKARKTRCRRTHVVCEGEGKRKRKENGL
jgi:hypothetical protein